MTEGGPTAPPAPAPNTASVPDTAPARYVLRLFVAGTTANSLRAIANLRRICDAHLPGRSDLEVVDIYQQPELAAQHRVVAAPMLLRLQPLPMRQVVGDLSDVGRVLKGLDLPAPLPDAE